MRLLSEVGKGYEVSWVGKMLLLRGVAWLYSFASPSFQTSWWMNFQPPSFK